jgi:hypothetical protein
MKTSSCVLTIIFESGARFEYPRTAHLIPEKEAEKEFLNNNYIWFRDLLNPKKGELIEEIEFFFPPDMYHKHKFNKHLYRLNKEITFF